jgi:CRP/FNR family transcriptional regulator, cyclic AMP receptor protein
MKTMKDILKEHAFFKDLKEEYLDFVAGCASNVRFRQGDTILKEGDPADKFYLIKEGKVAIYIAVGGHRNITIETIESGKILGWSWLIPPYVNRFNSRAVEDTAAIALDGKCLRQKCESNHDLGFELLRKITNVFTERLEATRMQLINVYNIEVEKQEIE